MWSELASAFRITLVLTILTGFLYPAIVAGVAQTIFPRQAHGSLVSVGGKVVGSSLIGQNFAKPEYFHPRPSSAGNGYDAANSGGSNLGPTSGKLMNGTTKKDDKGKEVVDFDGIKDRIVHYCLENDLACDLSVPLDTFKDAKGDLDDVKLINAFNDDKTPLVISPKAPIPADAVTASGSGLDPHITPANAEIQVARVAKARGASVEAVRAILAESTEGAWLGFIGEPRVNVLQLNIALDRRLPRK